MNTASLVQNNQFNTDKPAISILLDTESSKEIKILMKKGQIMKKHQTPYPIVVEIFDGSIDFGVNNQTLTLVKGDIISLKGTIPHDLLAKEDAIIRLSLSKLDNMKRVKQVVD